MEGKNGFRLCLLETYPNYSKRRPSKPTEPSFCYNFLMNHSYNSPESADAYREFLSSEDGKIFRKVLSEAFLSQIKEYNAHPSSVIPVSTSPDAPDRDEGRPESMPLNHGSRIAVEETPLSGMTNNEKSIQILDAGCGDGWLAGVLKENFPECRICACDAGEPLIMEAKKKFPKVEFSVHDLNSPLPYPDNSFDLITASMVIHDTENELAVMQNFARILKPSGSVIASIVNPYYGFPVGAWKRGIWGRLLGRKPKLKLIREYNRLAQEDRPSFEWRPHLGSHFTPLSRHIEAANKAGLLLTNLVDITSPQDSATYNLTYQLHRFPIILLLKFQKHE